MTVRAILARKGADVATIGPDLPLVEAVRILSEKRIGALVVTDGQRSVLGILSERDVVQVLAEGRDATLDRPVTTVMTRKVATCACDDTVADLMQQMTEGRFRHVPVIENGELVGIVSIGDVVKYRLEEMERESEALRDYIRTA